MMKKYRRSGWYGNSQGHALAARGVRLYARKQTLVDPLFYARRKEEMVKFSHLQDMVRQGRTFEEMKKMHPKADPEDVRKRGIKAIESLDGDSTLSSLDRNGIDVSVHMAQMSGEQRRKMNAVLGDPQKSSFLPEVKRGLLRKRLQ